MGQRKLVSRDFSHLSADEKGGKPMEKRKLTRRDFLRLSVMTAAGVVTAACAAATPVVIEKEVIKEVPVEKPVVIKEEVVKEVPVEKIVEKPVEKIVEKEKVVEKVITATPPPMPEEVHEAPMLRKLVEAGELPPLEERLPLNPRVIEPVEEIGQYGGTLHIVHTGPDMGTLKMKIGYDVPVVMNRDFTDYIPNLVSKWEFSEDGRTFTVYFRKGVKWSDGQPFTTEDLKFWWEDLALNEEYKVIPVPWWLFDYKTGKQAEVNFIDDYTVSFTFDSPAWLVPGTLGSGFWEWEPMMKPKYYLKQFHPKYNPDSNWDIFQDKDHWNFNPDYPVLFAWHVVSYKAGERVVLERNPYYWKVDTDGNQLPHIDRIESREIPDKELRLIQVAAGEYDFTMRGVTSVLNFSLLQEQAEKGDYHVIPYWGCHQEMPHYTVNQNYVGDEWMRGLLRDHRFMVALSHAIDRKRINDTLWNSLLEIGQATIGEQSWHFQSPEGKKVHEEWVNAYVEYDPEKSNRLLDELGLDKRDAEGFRTKPDGSKLEIIFDIAFEENVEGTPLLKEDWGAIGLRILLNPVYGTPEAELRHTEGKFQLGGLTGMGEFDLFHYPDEVFPIRPYRAFPMVGKWYATGGAEGWEPEPGSPEARLIEIYEKIMEEPDIEKGHRLVHQAVRIAIDNGPWIGGAVTNPRVPVVVKNNLRNVAEYGIEGPWAIGCPGNLNPEQWFFSK